MTQRFMINRRALRAPMGLLGLMVAGGFAMTTPASAQLEPTISQLSPEVLERVRQEEALLPQRPIQELELPRSEAGPEIDGSVGNQRMLVDDNSSAHYARGRTAVVHVFIDHAGDCMVFFDVPTPAGGEVDCL